MTADMPASRPQHTAPAIIEFEASSLDADGYPIEVGFILPNGVSFCSLIRPLPGWTAWCRSAQRAHGITRDLLERYGRAVDDIVVLMNERLHGQTVYCDGWTHDRVWLEQLYAAASRVPSFRLEQFGQLLDGIAERTWQETRARVERELGLTRHRASNDARILQMTWRRLFNVPMSSTA